MDSEDFKMKIDSRAPDERDDFPILITRGMFKQILRFMLGRNIEIPYIESIVESDKVIEGLLVNTDGKLEIAYSDGTVGEVDIWEEVIE